MNHWRDYLKPAESERLTQIEVERQAISRERYLIRRRCISRRAADIAKKGSPNAG